MTYLGEEKPSLDDLTQLTIPDTDLTQGGTMYISEEEYFKHFGTKGMKWGVRKAATGITNSQIKLHTKARDSKGIIGAVAQLDKHTWGRKGRFERMHNKRIGELERSKERIANGELAVRTLLFGPQYSRVKK